MTASISGCADRRLVTSTDYQNPYRPSPVKILNRLGNGGRRLGLSDRLEVDALLRRARRKTGLTDFGADGHLRALEVLVDSINDEAGLTPTGRQIQKWRLSAALINRLRIQELLRRHPEIADVDLGRIVLVAGLQRTGTTLLQRLLNSHPEIRGISGAEVLNPVPAVDSIEGGDLARGNLGRGHLGHGHLEPGNLARGERTRERRALLAKRVFSYLAPDFQRIHPTDHDEPEEEVLLIDLTFMSQSNEATMAVPSYADWLEGEDHVWSYEYLQRALKVLCWQRPARALVLKTPQHMEHLDAFRTVFPAATIVQTHRDPRKTVASFCSLVAHARGILSDRVDTHEIGRHWLRKTRRMVERSMQVREACDAEDSCRFIDVSYYDLTTDPTAELRRICERAGIAFDSDAERRAERCVEANPQNRFGRHDYRLADFGLSERVVDDAFSSYRAEYAIPFESIPSESDPSESDPPASNPLESNPLESSSGRLSTAAG